MRKHIDLMKKNNTTLIARHDHGGVALTHEEP